MADDNTIIEGTVKFRDGKKWKSRWCVMRKLSPAADCVHLQLYRDSRARWGAGAAGAAGRGGGCKASLSLQQYLGCETGFTLDKHSNTLALVCTDLVAILAFETRERLIQWQVKVSAHLGEARHYLVLVGAGARLAAGPARLHLHERRFALTAGVPPRLLGVWELAHLRRYGVVEGRFCFEGGSHCGKGEGLHVLITDQAKEVANDFDLASRGRLSPRRRPINSKRNEGAESPKSHKAFRSDTRLSELNTVDSSLPPIDLRLYEDPCPAEEAGAISPYWPSIERQFQDMGHGDTASVNETMEGTDTAPWGSGTGKVTLERCMSCMSKLGALSRSSTAALTPGAKHFNPAWTMDALEEGSFETCASASVEVAPPSANDKTEDGCRCPGPGRPPKPTRLELNLNRKPRMPLPTPICDCSRIHLEENKSRVGPYENYDVPKLASLEIDGEYYDTPKRLKECLNEELFQITKSSTPSAVILKKPCGCLLKFGRRRREPTVVEADDDGPPAACPCRRVTDWANSWVGLPYCRRSTVSSDDLARGEESAKPDSRSALYATIDLSRKTRRKTHPIEPDEVAPGGRGPVEVDDGPLANYENLSFALSLEHYENAKDLLRRAGVTQAELDAIGANLAAPAPPARPSCALCRRCGRPPRPAARDLYLAMRPRGHASGYTPMSPGAPPALARSASNPALGPAARPAPAAPCSSAGSARSLQDGASSPDTPRQPAARAPPGAAAPGNRDSSSSNDSGVSGCSLRRFELPPTTAAARRHYRSARRAAGAARAGSPPRRARSQDGPRHAPAPPACGSAEAEVPLLPLRALRGVADAPSTSSGTSDMSDYIETLSLCSSRSSTDAPFALRAMRETTSTLRPRSGKEYLQLTPRRPRPPPDPPHLYSDMP